MDHQEYRIPLNDASLNTYFELNGLKFTIVDYHNGLCLDQYGEDIRCFWGGNLSVTLGVDGTSITLDSQDKENDIVHSVSGFNMQGIRSIVLNRNRNETYLVFSIWS